MYPVYTTVWGHTPAGTITKRDRMRHATGRFDAEGRAPLAPISVGYSLWQIAYRFVDAATGEKTTPVMLGIVRIITP